MKPWLPVVACIFALGVAAASSPGAAAPAAKKTNLFVPPDGSCLLIVGQDLAGIDDYVAKVPAAPAGLMAYTSLKSLEGLSKKAEYFDAVQDCIALMEKYPKAVLQIGLYLVNSIDDAASGKLDANMDKLGDWIKSANRPIYLRVGYEFDFPENKYAPATYIKAFRRLRERLDRAASPTSRTSGTPTPAPRRRSCRLVSRRRVCRLGGRLVFLDEAEQPGDGGEVRPRAWQAADDRRELPARDRHADQGPRIADDVVPANVRLRNAEQRQGNLLHQPRLGGIIALAGQRLGELDDRDERGRQGGVAERSGCEAVSEGIGGVVQNVGLRAGGEVSDDQVSMTFLHRSECPIGLPNCCNKPFDQLWFFRPSRIPRRC